MIQRECGQGEVENEIAGCWAFLMALWRTPEMSNDEQIVRFLDCHSFYKPLRDDSDLTAYLCHCYGPSVTNFAKD